MFGLAGLVARHVRLPSPSCASSSCCLVLPSPPCGLRCFFLELPGERERRCPTIGKGLLLLRVHFLWPCNGQSHVVLGPPARLPLGGGKGALPTLPYPSRPFASRLPVLVGGGGWGGACAGVRRPSRLYSRECQRLRRSRGVRTPDGVQIWGAGPFFPHNAPISKELKGLRVKNHALQFLLRHHCPSLYLH